jgi:hypothetical protein
VSSFPVTGETVIMKITVVKAPNSKVNGKWCPWLIETPVEVVDADRK